jgi:hypothetical protein
MIPMSTVHDESTKGAKIAIALTYQGRSPGSAGVAAEV